MVQDSFGNYQDEFCLICGEIAVFNTGHFHRNGKVIIAGWCSKHHDLCCKAEYFLPVKECTMNGQGCFGEDGELPLLLEEVLKAKQREDTLRELGY